MNSTYDMNRFPNSCGGPRSSGFLGRSSIALPFKGALTRMESSDEEMRIVDIDLDILKVRLLNFLLFFFFRFGFNLEATRICSLGT